MRKCAATGCSRSIWSLAKVFSHLPFPPFHRSESQRRVVEAKGLHSARRTALQMACARPLEALDGPYVLLCNYFFSKPTKYWQTGSPPKELQLFDRNGLQVDLANASGSFPQGSVTHGWALSELQQLWGCCGQCCLLEHTSNPPPLRLEKNPSPEACFGDQYWRLRAGALGA